MFVAPRPATIHRPFDTPYVAPQLNASQPHLLTASKSSERCSCSCSSVSTVVKIYFSTDRRAAAANKIYLELSIGSTDALFNSCMNSESAANHVYVLVSVGQPLNIFRKNCKPHQRINVPSRMLMPLPGFGFSTSGLK